MIYFSSIKTFSSHTWGRVFISTNRYLKNLNSSIRVKPPDDICYPMCVFPDHKVNVFSQSQHPPPSFSLSLFCLHLFFTPWQGSAVPLDRLDYGYACLSEGNTQTQTDEPGIIMGSVMFSSHSVAICLPSNSAGSPQTPALFHLQ